MQKEFESFTRHGSPLATEPEAERYTRLSRATLRRAVAKGDLPRIKLGKRVFFHRDDLAL